MPASPVLQTFLHWSTARASPPYHLCADLRLLVHRVYCDLDRSCHRCHRALETVRRVKMCIVRDERLCFRCYHRARWPQRES
jgi:hypothetical protein